ncbi:putative ankyrin repeat and sam domain containing protein 6 protein [Botrytis fragariae]|uniref:Putative ankyrin repeat and sam domain containing protein 6 protein n=1 Tax=Botrytis fragariae TaxID=1964551 RepID=A0A8H6EMT6_9HELO|nr:putative ankyrin repeat and sam domain containing protein 6 protein [Botrytis fragariae]KAF5877904.1 putative ankyrin repeat and sam domain containing protein 6 protein [Botrytis fragariae]
MDPYQYQPINLGRASIRLLQLHKGDWSDKIQGQFINAWFDDSDSIMPYFALSYTWGYIDKVEEVIIDGAKIKVTFNLHMALQHLRSEEEDQIFWIDALCINQENVHEKIHQIRQMGDIYKKAEKVVIWLGRGTEDSDLVMDAMKRLRKASLGWHPAEWKDKSNGWVDENNEHLTNLREQMRLILERPWFRRIWILQEVANARRATTVHCGNRFISATIFSQFPALIALNPAAHCQSVLDIMPGISRQESWWAQGQKLHTLLVKFRRSEATDDRDKIYALLGMSSDAHRSNILDPKCDKSSQQVIREVISFILSEKYPQLIDDASLYQCLDWNLTKFLDNVEDLEGVILMDAFQGAEENFLKLLIETDVCRFVSRGFHDRTPVHWAVQREQPIILKMLLEAYLCSFEKRGSEKQTPLSLAIQTGNAKIVELVLNTGVDIEVTCLNGLTPLLLAIENDKINVVALLLRRGAEYKVQNKTSPEILLRGRDRSGKPISPISIQYYQLPLSAAIKDGNHDITKLLLDRGAALKDEDLSSAIECANDEMVELLIDHGIGTDTLKRGIRLRLAAKLGNVKFVGALIKRGYALESKNGEGQTPLMLAVKYGHYKTIKLLLESGAEIHSKDSFNQTPLMLAVIYGHYKTIKLLLESGAEIHSKDSFNQTPLTLAIKDGNKEFAELLLQHGAGINIESSLRMPLMTAIKNGNKEVVELLFQYGARIGSGISRVRPLIAAIKNGNKEVIKLLLQRGAEIHSKYLFDQTPLMMAIKNGNREIVELLLQNGADSERKAKGRLPPFLLATEWKHYDIVELLIQRGADIEVKDDLGRTALSLAAAYGILEIVRLLLENGAELETKDHTGRTPLQNVMASDGSIDDNPVRKGVVALLLAKGAKLGAKDREGKTPLQNLKASN